MADPADYPSVRAACAERIAALVDALVSIPDHLAPSKRAVNQAVREQIYYGWEKPLASARRARLLDGKYEIDGWWSIAAAELVNAGLYVSRSRQLERDHVVPASVIVNELIEGRFSPNHLADHLDARLETCTVLAEEHRRLGRRHGWDGYEQAGIRVRRGLR